VRWICPDDEVSKKLPIKPKKMVAKVRAGDMLYLPSLWFHQVLQETTLDVFMLKLLF